MSWEQVGSRRLPLVVVVAAVAVVAGMLLARGDGDGLAGRAAPDDAGLDVGEVTDGAAEDAPTEPAAGDEGGDRAERADGGGPGSQAERGAIGPSPDAVVAGWPRRAVALPGEPDLHLFSAHERDLVAVDLATGRVRARELGDLGLGVRLGVRPVDLVAVDGGVVAGRGDEGAVWIAPDLATRRELGKVGAPVARDASRVWLEQVRPDERRYLGVDLAADDEVTGELTLPRHAALVDVIDGHAIVAAGGAVFAVDLEEDATRRLSSGVVVGTSDSHVLTVECDAAVACSLVRRAPRGDAAALVPAPDALPAIHSEDAVDLLSPTGDHVLLPTEGGAGRSGLELVDLDHGARVEVASPLSLSAAAWSPDGAWLFDAAAGIAVEVATREAVDLGIVLGERIVVGVS